MAVESSHRAGRKPDPPRPIRAKPEFGHASHGLVGVVVGALRLAWRADPLGFLLAAGLQVMGAASTALLVVVGRIALAAILDLRPGSVDVGRLVVVVVLLAAVVAVGSACVAVQQQQQRLLAEQVSDAAWQRVLDITARVELEVHESQHFYERLQRMRSDALVRPVTMVNSALGLVGGGVGAAGMLVVLLTIDPLLVPVLVLAAVPAAVLSRRSGRLEARFAREVSPLRQSRDYVREVLTGRDEAKEVRAFGAAPVLRVRHDHRSGGYLSQLRRHVRIRQTHSIVGVTGAAVALAACLATLLWMVGTGRVGLAAAGAAVIAMRLVAGRLDQLFQSIGGLYESAEFVTDLEQPRAPVPEICPRKAGVRPTLRRAVSVDSVSYVYPGSDKPAIENVSVDIGAGEVIAIVGENGSGKTTLAKVVAGLYPPTTGAIRWDGLDTAEFQPAEVRRSVAVIFQDFIRYQLSALENIGLGDPDDVNNESAARRAAHRAGAAEFLERLPSAYATVLSRELESGSDLSLGQWQRVALARALRRDAPLVILDEPSSALDPRAEQALFTDVRAILDGRAALLISHRYSTVRAADRIYVMRDGHVVESGSHESLIAAGGLYAELFSAQAKAYR